MRRSLLRDISINTLKKQFNRISHGGAVLTSYDFSFKYNKNIKAEQKEYNFLDFHVNPESRVATNIHVIIGRNGAGKTRLLHNMVESYFNENLSDYFIEYNTTDEDFEDNNQGKNIFPNLVYSSYSAFDDMKILRGENYNYLGLRKEISNGEKISYGTKNLDELAEEFVKSFKNCMTYEKAPRLAKALKMLEFESIFKEANLCQFLDINILMNIKTDEKELDIQLKQKFEKFSTGHRVILITITQLVDSLEEKSLVLLDEPETHLHPPLLSAFIRCLSDLLLNRNAVAIIATHSTIILQEVPKNCVWKINRNGYESAIKRPKIETFGTGHTELNEEVFRLDIEKTGFHQLIYEAVNKMQSYEEFKRFFSNQIGKEADVIARTLFYLKGQKDDES